MAGGCAGRFSGSGSITKQEFGVDWNEYEVKGWIFEALDLWRIPGVGILLNDFGSARGTGVVCEVSDKPGFVLGQTSLRQGPQNGGEFHLAGIRLPGVA